MVIAAPCRRAVAAVYAGQGIFRFAQEAWQEAGRVSWPTRKETVQTTLIVFAFVVIMALILFSIDTTLAWIVKLLTGRGE
jgi:preprotein translocase subunit SecE